MIIGRNIVFTYIVIYILPQKRLPNLWRPLANHRPTHVRFIYNLFMFLVVSATGLSDDTCNRRNSFRPMGRRKRFKKSSQFSHNPESSPSSTNSTSRHCCRPVFSWCLWLWCFYFKTLRSSGTKLERDRGDHRGSCCAHPYGKQRVMILAGSICATLLLCTRWTSISFRKGAIIACNRQIKLLKNPPVCFSNICYRINGAFSVCLHSLIRLHSI